jgi:hypothetical protein
MTRRTIMTPAVLTLSALLAAALFCAACSEPDTHRFYDGYEEDIQLFREHYRPESMRFMRTLETGPAHDAAERLFTRINFVGMTDDEVVAALAEPVHKYASDVAGHARAVRWVYVLTNGWKDAEWVIYFKDGKVAAVEKVERRNTSE